MGQFERYIGKKLDGRYELKEIIGIGGMSVVYSAMDTETKQMVAVKLLKEEYLANDEFRRRFKTESKAISVLSHPNIVNVHDVCLGDRLQYIVMELVDGITLKEYIELKKVVSWKDCLYFMSQVLSALMQAHEKGIVHRDIKPQNILLLQSGVIKVTDFGIARFAHSNSDTMTSSRAIGSVHYMSPEQARGEQADSRSDIYSVGVLLYEMLTGRLPFVAENAVSVAVMQMNSDPVPPRSINPEIPEGLEDVVLKCMQKNPDFRYQSAVEMLEALEEFKKNPSISFSYKYFSDGSQQHVAEVVSTTKEKKAADRRSGGQKNGGGSGFAKGRGGARPAGGEYKSRWMGTLLAITGSVVLATLLFVVSAVLLRTTLLKPSGEEVDLPNFVGLSVQQIISEEEFQKFDIVFDYENSQHNDNYPKDVIYEQRPSPPKKVVAGSRITLKVSKGASLVPLPDFSMRERSAVATAVENLGLFPKIVERFSPDVPQGYVISTSPEKGSNVELGSTVIIYVSTDNSTKAVEVPYALVNSTISEATAHLTAAGLKVGQIIYSASSTKRDIVISAEPKPGTGVLEGSTVDLIVSDGAFYNNTTRTMTVRIDNLPQRSFRYLVEVYLDDVEEPVHTAVVDPGDSSFDIRIEILDGAGSLLVKANGQILREIVVNYDDEEYYQRGIDYAIDLSPGYVSDDYVPPVNSTPWWTSSTAASTAESSDSLIVDDDWWLDYSGLLESSASR